MSVENKSVFGCPEVKQRCHSAKEECGDNVCRVKLTLTKDTVWIMRNEDQVGGGAPGRCTTPNLVYRATVTTSSSVEKYVGLTANTFKERYSKHKQDLAKPDGRTSTTLAGHVWDLKDSQTDFQLKWEVVCRAAPFSPTSRACNLCTAEKWNILFDPKNATLNKRLEIFNHCRHKERMLIVKKVRRLRKPGS